MDTLDGTDVVQTAAQAAALPRAPLVVLEALEGWLDERGLGSGPLRASRLPGGHSNVTMLIRRPGLEVVLRRAPRPPLPPGAHDIVREARVLRGLETTAVPVPRIIDTCESEAVLGAPFVLMEYVPGLVLDASLPPELEPTAERRRAAQAFIDTLVSVHAVDITAAGLAWLGRPGSYLERQLRRFSGSWQISRTRQVKAMTALERQLRAGLPRDYQTTLIHGDARLGNAIFAADPPARVAALIDWEMATLGDPLADLGYLSAAWTDRGQTDTPLFHLSPVTALEGFPTLSELIERYERRSGRSADDLPWYTALACWKSAVFMEGNYRRALSGNSDDPFALGFRTGVEELAELGLSALR
ncbi:MAG TPA: phosphotransferase family protein [Solirubrobacteraceae bacterium]|jgi:aminoglycoside phosphotransferase (APT) family kinase protein|nr:phosphotransferase family protein [Solirubrobacteraceae bacterium]